MMIESEALRRDVEAGRVACGINHTMTDHRSNRPKDFDLVFHRASSLEQGPSKQTFRGLLNKYGVVLTQDQRTIVESLPDVPVRSVAANAVYVVFEAKACMTAHQKARPRLFDELNSSQQTIHGDTERAIAAGLVLVNVADTFISPVMNRKGPVGPHVEVTQHKQPRDFEIVVAKVKELRRRAKPSEEGFDALGIIAISCKNDGSPVLLHEAPVTLKNFEYEHLIARASHLYETHFHRS